LEVYIVGLVLLYLAFLIHIVSGWFSGSVLRAAFRVRLD
jgi:hypothetical protein